MRSHPSLVALSIIAQLLVGIGALASLAFAPPVNGTMLLVPLSSDAPTVALARNADALLIGRGPGTSVLIRGERRALFWPLLRGGVLAIAAPAGLCGADA